MREKLTNGLMSFGIEKPIAEHIVDINSYSDVETILDFLTSYGKMIKIN